MAKFHHMTPEQRQQFIEHMVDSLAGRLEQNGKDLEGWMQLVRAYVVLGRSAGCDRGAGEGTQQLRRR